MKKYILLSAAICCFVLGCSKENRSASEPTRNSRPLPAINEIKEVTLAAATDELFLTDYDRQHNRSILTTTILPTSKKSTEGSQVETTYQPVLQESYASGGSGGLLRYADSGNLTDIDLDQAVAAIKEKGAIPANQLLKGNTSAESSKLVEAANFSPGSIWIVSIQDRGSVIVAIQLGEEFVPNTKWERSVKFHYKVLEFKPE